MRQKTRGTTGSVIALLLIALAGMATTANAWRRPSKMASILMPSTVLFPGKKTKRSLTQKERKSQVEAVKSLGLLSGYVTKLFNEADSNRDGAISPDELYELVLKFYVKVNRQAPVAAPSRERVMILFNNADVSHSGRLDIHEFRRLVRTLYARVSSRIVAFKVVKILCAPILAIRLVDALKGTSLIMHLFDNFVTESTPSWLASLLTKETVWSAVFTLLCVIGLGKTALRVIDYLWWGPRIEGTDYEGVDELVAKK